MYAQSVHNGLDVMQGHHIGQGARRVYGPPEGFTILVFSLKIILLKQCYCCRNNTLHRLKPRKITEITTIY